METIYRIPLGNGFAFVTMEGLRQEALKVIGPALKNQTPLAYAAQKFEDELWRADWCARAATPPKGADMTAWAFLFLSAGEVAAQ